MWIDVCKQEAKAAEAECEAKKAEALVAEQKAKAAETEALATEQKAKEEEKVLNKILYQYSSSKYVTFKLNSLNFQSK